MKTKYKKMKRAKHRFKWKFIMETWKKRTWLWCKLIPKIGVEQTKKNMKRTTSIYVTLNQDVSKYFKIFIIILKYFKSTQNISKKISWQIYNSIMNV